MTNFDAYAASYDETLSAALAVSGESKEYFARGRIDFLKDCLRELPAVRVSSILDFGCGVGADIPLLRKTLAAERIIGVDISAECLDVARRRCPPPSEFSLSHEYTPHGDMDLAFCNGVFHHIVPTARAEALQLIARSLRAGGIFSFWENNPWNPGARYVMARCEFDRDAIVISAREAVTMIRAAGLRVLGVRFLFVFPRVLRLFRWSERHLTRIPLGAQYQVLSVKS
jgi:SAM-dependent methyltransferase